MANVLLRWAIILVAALALADPSGRAATPQSGVARREWKPAAYRGLTVGVSTRADLFRTLGAPNMRSRDADTGAPILLYLVDVPIKGWLSVYVAHNVIEYMALTPSQQLRRDDVVRVFGPDFTLATYAVENCLAKNGTSPAYESSSGSIQYLEYRSRGVAISLYDDEPQEIVFTHHGLGSSHSRCKGSKRAMPTR